MKYSKLLVLQFIICVSIQSFAQDFKFDTQTLPEKKTIYLNEKNVPLIIINGKPSIAGLKFLENLSPEQIKTFTVLQSKDAVAQYGDVATNGAILIETQNISRRKLRKLGA